MLSLLDQLYDTRQRLLSLSRAVTIAGQGYSGGYSRCRILR
jgi:hypothetical protein